MLNGMAIVLAWMVCRQHSVNMQQNIKIVLVPMKIIYRSSEIGNSDSNFFHKNSLFSQKLSDGILWNSGIKAEISIPDPPARDAVPEEFATKLQ